MNNLSQFEIMLNFFAILGLLFMLSKLLPIIQIIRINLSSLKNLNNKYGKGSWALVTGSTDGIGLGFCHVLAEHSFNIILVSRNIQKLEETR